MIFLTRPHLGGLVDVVENYFLRFREPIYGMRVMSLSHGKNCWLVWSLFFVSAIWSEESMVNCTPTMIMSTIGYLKAASQVKLDYLALWEFGKYILECKISPCWISFEANSTADSLSRGWVLEWLAWHGCKRWSFRNQWTLVVEPSLYLRGCLTYMVRLQNMEETMGYLNSRGWLWICLLLIDARYLWGRTEQETRVFQGPWFHPRGHPFSVQPKSTARDWIESCLLYGYLITGTNH